MWSWLLILLILLFHYLINFESFLFIGWSLSHFLHLTILSVFSLLLWDVKDLKECKIIEFIQIDTFQYYLSYNKVYVLFFQLNLSKKFSQVFLWNCSLSIFSIWHCCQNLLIIRCDQLSNLQKHFLLFSLWKKLKSRH